MLIIYRLVTNYDCSVGYTEGIKIDIVHIYHFLSCLLDRVYLYYMGLTDSDTVNIRVTPKLIKIINGGICPHSNHSFLFSITNDVKSNSIFFSENLPHVILPSLHLFFVTHDGPACLNIVGDTSIHNLHMRVAISRISH